VNVIGNIRASCEDMRKYYALVNVEHRQLGTHVSAENVAAAFEAATFKCRKQYPRLHVETIAVQEIVDEHAI
jgi:hypothetical protein